MSPNTSQNLADAARSVIDAQFGKDLPPALYIVSTPIGNLADITLRALCVMAQADHVLCEDTRQTQKLLNHYNIKAKLSAYHEHNAERMRPKILSWLSDEARIVLVSDAGTPLISDPGYKLARKAAETGSCVISIPGPCAVLAGLTSSGLPTDSFFFAGFLPTRAAASEKRLKAVSEIPATLVFFESASRLDRTLKILAAALPDRDLVIARELTKKFEEIIRLRLGEDNPPERSWKGEFVLLVGPPEASEPDWDEIEDQIRSSIQSSSLRDVVDEIVRTFGVQKKLVYNLALNIQKENSGARHEQGEKTQGK